VTGHPESGTGRIRWQLGEGGILFGYSGTLKPWVFAICPPSAPGDFWMISTPFPLSQPRYVGSEQEARAAAERWLAEFIALLGAIFPEPEPDGQLPRQPLIRDLAIVLAGSLHPGAQLTPGTKLVASRLRDVLHIGDGRPPLDPVYGYRPGSVKVIEAKLSAALGGETRSEDEPEPVPQQPEEGQ
jgi:hypothetical protein